MKSSSWKRFNLAQEVSSDGQNHIHLSMIKAVIHTFENTIVILFIGMGSNSTKFVI